MNRIISEKSGDVYSRFWICGLVMGNGKVEEVTAKNIISLLKKEEWKNCFSAPKSRKRNNQKHIRALGSLISKN